MFPPSKPVLIQLVYVLGILAVLAIMGVIAYGWYDGGKA